MSEPSASRPPLDALFDVRAVAVIGASAKRGNLGGRVVYNLGVLGFQGEVYPVGPSEEPVHGHPVLRSVLDAPGPVDLAVIAVAAPRVPQVLEECGQKGVRYASIISAGFGEFTAERAALDQELLDVAARHGLRFLGPNCQGILDTRTGVCTGFGVVREDTLAQGSAGLLAQSGTVVFTLARLMSREGLGVSRFASVGNKLDVDEVDLLPLFLAHPETRVVCMYLESIRRGRALVEVAERAAKPIVLLKGNVAPASAGIARSHSASILNDQRVVAAAARQAGIVLVEQLNDFAVVPKAFLLPPMRGNRLVIVAGSGGMAVVAADWAHRRGFALPPLPAATAAAIERRQPLVKIANPVDLGDFFDLRETLAVLNEVLALPDVDGMALSMFDPTSTNYYNPPERPFQVELQALAERHGKPIAVTYAADPASLQTLRAQAAYPVFTFVDEAVQGLAALRDYTRHRERPREAVPPPLLGRATIEAVLARARAAERRELDYVDAFTVLAAAGIPVEMPHLLASAEAAVRAAREAEGAVALKLLAQGISHKTEAQGVRLGLTTDDAVFAAASDLLDAYPGAHLALQRMVSGVELMLGARRDPQFGPLVSVGLGGTLVELWDDAALRLAPITPAEARAMLAETRAARLLAGWRGQPAVDAAGAADALQRLSALIAAYPAIVEIDVNPLMVMQPERGVRAVDVRVFVE
jgi:acetate---CoA ligase (ADP-forming)